MPAPLYQAKAEFFWMLGHPVRIRVLELLQDGPKPVRDLLAEIDIESSSVSQQLAILRRSDIVTRHPPRHHRRRRTRWRRCRRADPRRAGSSPRCAPGQNQLLAELRESLTEPA
ncbi:MAG TPA: ArsR family transcriptional regulator [Streptosporangiaceae bacterium]|nr:ArsR family transcriptional regulator [Streptosporangiaceae bacterium]